MTQLKSVGQSLVLEEEAMGRGCSSQTAGVKGKPANLMTQSQNWKRMLRLWARLRQPPSASPKWIPTWATVSLKVKRKLGSVLPLISPYLNGKTVLVDILQNHLPTVNTAFHWKSHPVAQIHLGLPFKESGQQVKDVPCQIKKTLGLVLHHTCPFPNGKIAQIDNLQNPLITLNIAFQGKSPLVVQIHLGTPFNKLGQKMEGVPLLIIKRGSTHQHICPFPTGQIAPTHIPLSKKTTKQVRLS